MKSLGPYAYINDDPGKQKPTHISTAIGETLGQIGTTAKPPAGASMPDNPPEKGPKRSPHKSNDGQRAPVDTNATKPPPAERASNEPPPARSPGRPPKMRIDNVNISTDLELDERFIEFREITGATEAEALISIIALYKYAARHNADTGSIANLSDEKLAKRCYWQQNPELFIKALIESGFLTPDRVIADWQTTQPHAIKRAHNIKQHETKKKQELE